MAKFLQPSLSSGELSPGLRGRVDMARYATSLARARNFITKPTGGGAKRPGTYFRGYVKFSNRITRLVPFVYSTSVKYLIEMGHLYMRFWVDGALLTNSTKVISGISNANPAVVTSAAHGFVDGQHVVLQGLKGGMGRLNGRTYEVNQLTGNTYELIGANTLAFGAYAGGGTASRIVEVTTPYTENQVRAVHFTQSADILYMVHGQVEPKELQRVAVDQFNLVPYAFRRGPFRPFNSDEAAILTTDGVTGIVTATLNVDTFLPSDVGSLIYAEEKELRDVKPWASAEKNVPLNALRRSDSKVYQATDVPTVTPPNYYVTGGVRPIHDDGRAFDGPQDVKSDGVNSYTVGVEWQFLHNTFGIMKITEYIDARNVKAEVIERLPNSIKGQTPAPGGTWTLDGAPPQVQFTIAGATSFSKLDYQVTIGGVPVQSNPNYPGGGGVGGGGGGNPRPGGGGIIQGEL